MNGYLEEKKSGFVSIINFIYEIINIFCLTRAVNHCIFVAGYQNNCEIKKDCEIN
jgi:hypothetical protein